MIIRFKIPVKTTAVKEQVVKERQPKHFMGFSISFSTNIDVAALPANATTHYFNIDAVWSCQFSSQYIHKIDVDATEQQQPTAISAAC